MTSFVVAPAQRPLSGQVAIPGDKSMGHRALLFSLLTRGPIRIAGLGGGADNGRTARAIVQLGARVERDGEALVVRGAGLGHLVAPADEIDCGNSGTTIRLLTGLLAGQPFASRLTGDESLSRRPMKRVIEPLRAMGAQIDGEMGPGGAAGDLVPPLRIAGRSEPLRGMTHTLAIASAQVKTALILAGLTANGVTRVSEPGPSRDHTERLLIAMGAPLVVHGREVVIDPTGWDRSLTLPGGLLTVPGDPSSCAFLVAAALVVGATEVVCTGVGVNPTRTGFLDVLTAMGAEVTWRDPRVVGGEPVADLVVRGAAPELRATEIAGDLTVRSIDEIPILAAVAALASGTTIVRDAEELRVKESDRIATTVAMLRAFGVDAEPRSDGLAIVGQPGRQVTPARVDAAGDHRIAMAAAVLAFTGTAPSRVDDVTNVATSFPTFVDCLRALGATIEVLAAP